MELIEVILSKENLNRAHKKVVANKGASGVDGVTVEELGDYIRKNKDAIVTSIRNRTYPLPVKYRVPTILYVFPRIDILCPITDVISPPMIISSSAKISNSCISSHGFMIKSVA